MEMKKLHIVVIVIALVLVVRFVIIPLTNQSTTDTASCRALKLSELLQNYELFLVGTAEKKM